MLLNVLERSFRRLSRAFSYVSRRINEIAEFFYSLVGPQEGRGVKSADDIQKQEYAVRLYERRNEGVLINRVEVSIGEWRPLPNQCHSNVTEWCAHDHRYKPIRGWLYFDLAPLNFVKFVSHSVVQAPDGHLYDITPTLVPRSYPFIPATEPEHQYAAMNELGTTELWHRTRVSSR